MRYTQGNWERGLNTNTDEWMKVFCNGKPIARALTLNKVGERKENDFREEQANAKLIAASPLMLEALKNVKAIIKHEDYPIYTSLLQVVQNAIDKATL